jgi:hypothetical protein
MRFRTRFGFDLRPSRPVAARSAACDLPVQTIARLSISDALASSVEVVQGLEGVLPYTELRAGAIDVELAGVTIPVCALEHLRTMKQAAGRPRDLVDLDDLDAAQPPSSK